MIEPSEEGWADASSVGKKASYVSSCTVLVGIVIMENTMQYQCRIEDCVQVMWAVHREVGAGKWELLQRKKAVWTQTHPNKSSLFRQCWYTCR
jgi:hypothetical protein